MKKFFPPNPYLILDFIQRILLWLRGETLKLLVLAGILLLVWGFFAPVGTLVWWFNEGSQIGLNINQPKLTTSPQSTITNANINCYIVFLPGVGDFSADELTPGEEIFLDRLVELHPNCVAVRDVFPYSAANVSLGGQRFFAFFWRAAQNASGWLENANVFIKIRNLWRFAISADDRYGSIYNQGIATAIVDRMNAAYPIPNQDRVKIILIGTSGGAQVALGAAPYLHNWLGNAQQIVISVGGSFDGTSGFAAVNHVYHLQGKRDWVDNITRFVFPSRWRSTVTSPFNLARLQGRYTVVGSGPHTHDGAQGYFGEADVQGSNTTYVELTLETLNKLPIW